MSQFRDNYGFGSCDLEQVALRGGVLASMGYGFDCPRAIDRIPGNPEWGTRIINKKGMGNHGSIVLKGNTPKTRAMIRQGKINTLIARGVCREVANAAVHVSHGMEPGIAELAEKLLETAWRGDYKGSSHREFSRWAYLLSEDMYSGFSHERKSAAAAIASKALDYF